MTMEIAVRIGATAREPAVKRLVWKDLGAHYRRIRDLHLRQLFADDPERGERLSTQALGLDLDYSKNCITDEALYEHSAVHPGRNLEHRLVRPVGCRVGEVLAQHIIPELESKAEATLAHDSSTNNLIRLYRKSKETV